MTVHRDARLFLADLAAGAQVVHALDGGCGAWLQLARGIIGLNGTEMRDGDGAAIADERPLTIAAETDAELLLFDLA